MVLTYTWKQVLGKEAQVTMGGQREKGGGRREATGVVLCPWERYVDVGSSHPWEL